MENYNSSFISMLNTIAINMSNMVDTLNKINDVVSANGDVVEISNVDPTTNEIVKIQLPTINKLSYDFQQLAETVKKYTAFNEGDTMFLEFGNTVKKIKSIDLYKEPAPISTLNLVSTFSTQNNWFFENMMNPILKVTFDLNDKVDDNVSKILSRRYMVKFQKYSDGSLTSVGSQSYDDFVSKYLGSTNIDLTEFLSWYSNPNNTGVINNLYPEQSMDEEMFDISLRESIYTGNFDVLRIDVDDVNNKIWYELRDDKYYDKSTNSRKSLVVNDEIILNKKGSVSRFKIIEISKATNNVRINVEQIEGFDIIPVGSQVIQIYSNFSTNKNVKIGVGYDEYIVVFFKTINGENNMVSSLWSKGVGFYSNDLILESNNNIKLPTYYNDFVYDYGDTIKDLVEKKIPSKYGLVPNIPVLNTANFKVIQTNSYLNDSKENDKIKDLNAQLSTTKSQISNLDNAISRMQTELSVKNYASTADKDKAVSELNKKQNEKNIYVSKLKTTANQITSSKLTETTKPEYELQGFWEFPEAQQPENLRSQEVIGFYIEYRKSSKSNNTNNTTTLDFTTSKGRLNAAISNWIPIYTDVRKRVYNETTGLWEWQVEDVSSADTPNVNQLRLTFLPNEKIEIRIKSISEVGYPDVKLMSDFSEVMSYSFPDDLNVVGDENETILKAANQEELVISMNENLDAKGYTKHLEESYTSNNQYTSHKDKSVMTSQKDTNGNYYMLDEFLTVLINKIKVLEETVLRYKGELQVVLKKGNSEVTVNNNSVKNYLIECEDYGVRSGSTNRTYINNLYCIKDFTIFIKNISANNPLGFLTSKNYNNISFYNHAITTAIPIWVNADNIAYRQEDNQFIYLKNFDDNNPTVSGYTNNNQISNILKSNYNLGFNSSSTGVDITTDTFWVSGLTGSQGDKFGATVHPVVSLSLSEIKDVSENKLKVINANNYIEVKLNIYFRFEINSTSLSNTTTNVITATNNNKIINKKLKFYLEPENMNRPFEFTVNLDLRQYRNSNITTGEITQDTNTNVS